MRVLFLTNTLPFPPRNGRELPIAHIIGQISKKHTVDVLVLDNTPGKDFTTRRNNVPAFVNKTGRVRIQKRNAVDRIFKEWFLVEPSWSIGKLNSHDLNIMKEFSGYDVVWVSPLRCIGYLGQCKKMGIDVGEHVAIGLNDVKTNMYLDSLREFFSGRLGLDWPRLYRGIRTTLMKIFERRYLGSADLIHVQTTKEKRRAEVLLNRTRTHGKIVVAANGKKTKLEHLKYKGIDSKKVLYMTNLDSARVTESRWFLKEVWPVVYAQYPNSELLLVGAPPSKHAKINQLIPESAKVLGYVDSLEELFESVSVVVVPTLHSTGLVNRIQDALVAGVPVVSTPEALSTIDNLEIGKHALAADNAEDFASKLISLLNDRDLRASMSNAGRQLAESFPGWEETTNKILTELESLSG